MTSPENNPIDSTIIQYRWQPKHARWQSYLCEQPVDNLDGPPVDNLNGNPDDNPNYNTNDNTVNLVALWIVTSLFVFRAMFLEPDKF
jgi:hypothetical protein